MDKYANVINEVGSVLYDGDTLVSLVVSHRGQVGGDAIEVDMPFDPNDTETLLEVLEKHFPDGANCNVDYFDGEYVIWLCDTDVY